MPDFNEKYQSTPATICISLDEECYMGPHAVSGSTLMHMVDPVVSSESNATSSSTHIYSEGGWRANVTVLGAFVALFFSFGQMNAFGTFQAWYAGHQLQHLPASTISWIGSLQLWMFFFSVRLYTYVTGYQFIWRMQGAPIGRLFDAYGPRGLMLAGTICYVASTMLTSICRDYYQYILCQGVLFGLSVGLLYVLT